jgi:hypothetical protein
VVDVVGTVGSGFDCPVTVVFRVTLDHNRLVDTVEAWPVSVAVINQKICVQDG